jgi:hypothetical protein
LAYWNTGLKCRHIGDSKALVRRRIHAKADGQE